MACSTAQTAVVKLMLRWKWHHWVALAMACNILHAQTVLANEAHTNSCLMPHSVSKVIVVPSPFHQQFDEAPLSCLHFSRSTKSDFGTFTDLALAWHACPDSAASKTGKPADEAPTISIIEYLMPHASEVPKEIVVLSPRQCR